VQVESQAAREGNASREGARPKHLQLVVESVVNVDRWRVRLTNPDLDARELAFDELIREARGDYKLRLALQSWSVDPAEEDLGWAARLAQRELERPRLEAGQIAWMHIPGQGGQSHIPGERGQAASEEFPAAGTAGPSAAATSQRLRRFDWRGAALPLDDPPRITGLYVPRQFQIPRMGEARAVKRIYHFYVQPEGVVLVQTELSGAGIQERRFAAGSLESLLKQHPHLRDQVPGLATFVAKPFAPGSEMRWGSGQVLLRFDPNRFSNTSASAARERESHEQGRVSTFVLGVMCVQLPGDEAQARLLGPGVGLLIERREPGSVAEELGLQRGDILVELAGQPLCSVEEISRALRERSEEKIEVKFIDRAGIERRRTWNPEATHEGGGPPP